MLYNDNEIKILILHINKKDYLTHVQNEINIKTQHKQQQQQQQQGMMIQQQNKHSHRSNIVFICKSLSAIMSKNNYITFNT